MVNAQQSINSISTPFPQLMGLRSPSSDDRLPESGASGYDKYHAIQWNPRESNSRLLIFSGQWSVVSCSWLTPDQISSNLVVLLLCCDAGKLDQRRAVGEFSRRVALLSTATV